MAESAGRFDAIILGSGMSGLASANILAREGLSVLCLEQHVQFGGYLQQFALHGTLFDSGCHYVGALGPGQVFDRYLRYLGVRDDISARPLDPDGFDVFVYPEGRFAFPVGHAALEARLVESFPHEREGIRAFLGEVRAEVAAFPMYALRPGIEPGGELPPARSLAEVLDAHLRDPRLREILSAHVLLHFVPPAECPFSLHAFVLDSYLQGAYTLDGGGRALALALLRRLRERGGEAKRRRRATAIEVVDGAVRAVRTEAGERWEAPVVIACIDPKVALSLLPADAVRPAFRHRVDRLRPGIGGMAAYLRVSADLGRYARSNFFLMGPEGQEGVFSERWLREGGDPPIYVTVPSAREGARGGVHALIALTGLRADHFAPWERSGTGARGAAYEDAKQALGARLLVPLLRFMPELEGAIQSVDYATPLTHRDYTLNDGGAIYGVHHAIDQSGVRGVGWRTRVRGLLLAGHSVLYPGLLGATISAFYACGELVGLGTLHRRLMEA